MLAVYTIILISLLLIMGSAGYLTDTSTIKVNYTRKIIHFSWFFIPIIVFSMFEVDDPKQKIIISVSVFVTVLSLISTFFRKQSRFFELCFASIDRPEDRPKTLLWLTTQTIAGYFVLIFFYKIFLYYNIHTQLLYLTLLSVTIGDGIAEPIGVRFGKNKYCVTGFFDKRLFYRTIEGSVAIYIVSFLLCVLFQQFFSLKSLIVLLVLYPPLLTLVEAKSPHTWDTPFLFFAGNMFIVILQSFN